MFFELGFARAVVKGKYKYLAVRYPEYAINASLEERTEMLNGYNEMRRSFGGKAVKIDLTLPYGHLKMFPGGGDTEKATNGNKSGFCDPDQLYDLEADPTKENPESHQACESLVNERLCIFAFPFVLKAPELIHLLVKGKPVGCLLGNMF